MDSYDTTEEERQLVVLQKQIEYKKQSKQTFQKLLEKLAFPNNKQTRQIVQKKADNLVITADTQVGKTKIIIDCMKETTDNALKVFVCDNKKDQMIQMKNRCLSNNINCNTLSYMKKKDNRRIGSIRQH